jgi:hypothetical protein
MRLRHIVLRLSLCGAGTPARERVRHETLAASNAGFSPHA